MRPVLFLLLLSPGWSEADRVVDEAWCAPPEPGFLSVDTTPWTEVTVDGERVGTTPLFRVRLAAGEHVVQFVNEQAGVADEERVVVEERHVHKLKLLLQVDAQTQSVPVADASAGTRL